MSKMITIERGFDDKDVFPDNNGVNNEKKNNEIIEISKNGEIIETEKIKSVKGELFDLDGKLLGIDLKGLLCSFSRFINVSEILKNVKVESELVLVIPKEFREGLKNGENWIMENVNGDDEFWPYIMGVAENGRCTIKKPLGVNKKDFIKNNPIQDLSQQFQNAYLQGQMREISQRLEESIDILKQIDRDQKDIVLGELSSGKELLYLSFNQSDFNETNMLFNSAIMTLSNSKGKLTKLLCNRVESFEPIPKSKFTQIIKVIISRKSDYLSKSEEKYREIQNFFDYVSEATKMIATAFLLVGDYKNAECVYDLTADEMKKIDFTNVETARYLSDKIEGVCLGAIKQFEEEKIRCLEQQNNNIGLSIKLNRKLLTEVLESEKPND